MKSLFSLFLILALVSCTTARENAYKTLASTAAAVDTAMKAYADARVAGKVSDDTHAKVLNLKSRYEHAFLAAATAAQVNLESPTPTDLINITTRLLQLVNSATTKPK